MKLTSNASDAESPGTLLRARKVKSGFVKKGSNLIRDWLTQYRSRASRMSTRRQLKQPQRRFLARHLAHGVILIGHVISLNMDLYNLVIASCTKIIDDSKLTLPQRFYQNSMMERRSTIGTASSSICICRHDLGRLVWFQRRRPHWDSCHPCTLSHP